jgi:hypothetical protein
MAGVALAAAVLLAARPGQSQGSDDHAVASAMIQQLAQDTTHTAITAATLTRASEALERATRLRGAGDETHARAADGMAREWAETARDLVRSVDAEAAAADLRRRAVEAQARVERTRALVEEAIARVGRLTSELEAAGKSTAKDRTAVDVHDSGRASSGGTSNSATTTGSGSPPSPGGSRTPRAVPEKEKAGSRPSSEGERP